MSNEASKTSHHAPAHHADVKTKGRSLVNKPYGYDRDKAKYKSWWQSMFTYVRNKKNNITSDSKRIDVVLSYIRGDHVDAWVQNYSDQNFNEKREEWRASWAQFKEHLKEQFVDSNLVRDARDQIERLRQRQDTAQDFFQKFEILLTQAEYSKDDTYVVHLLETNINEKIIDQIYGSRDGLPEEYKDWKKQIIQIDHSD